MGDLGFTDYDNMVPKDMKFGVKIKNKIKKALNQKELIYGITIECVQQHPVSPPNPYSPPAILSSDEFCISGLPGFDGEYNHIESVPASRTTFKKEDKNGVAFIYWDEVTNNRYIIGTDTTQNSYECMTNDGNTGYQHAVRYGEALCSVVGVVGSSVIEGECQHHLTLSHILGINMSDKVQTIFMLAMLSMISCVLGMVTCRCCQVMLSKNIKTKRYAKVSKKEFDINV